MSDGDHFDSFQLVFQIVERDGGDVVVFDVVDNGIGIATAGLFLSGMSRSGAMCLLGIAVFDQANEGAQEAHKELGNKGKLDLGCLGAPSPTRTEARETSNLIFRNSWQ